MDPVQTLVVQVVAGWTRRSHCTTAWSGSLVDKVPPMTTTSGAVIWSRLAAATSWHRPVSSVTGPGSAATNTASWPGAKASTSKGPMMSRAVNPGYSTKAIFTGFGGCWPPFAAAGACSSGLGMW